MELAGVELVMGLQCGLKSQTEDNMSDPPYHRKVLTHEETPLFKQHCKVVRKLSKLSRNGLRNNENVSVC
jgi:hypothetical protein